MDIGRQRTKMWSESKGKFNAYANARQKTKSLYLDEIAVPAVEIVREHKSAHVPSCHLHPLSAVSSSFSTISTLWFLISFTA